MACLYIKILWRSYYDVTSVDLNSKQIRLRYPFSTDKIYYKIPKCEIGTLTKHDFYPIDAHFFKM